MGKMKDLAICIDEIMEKIEESLDGYVKDAPFGDIRKEYIYKTLSELCNLRAERLEDEIIHKYAIKENEDDERSIN